MVNGDKEKIGGKTELYVCFSGQGIPGKGLLGKGFTGYRISANVTDLIWSTAVNCSLQWECSYF